MWEKVFDNIRRKRVLVFNGESVSSVEGLPVAPFGAVVTHKVRIINGYSFDVQAARGEKVGLKKGSHTEEVSKCLCGQALPTILQARTDLRERFPRRRILSAKPDVTGAFKKVRVTPHRARNVCYVVDGVLV